MKLKILVMMVLTVLLLTGCNGSSEDLNIVYTTVYPVSYLVEEIAGDTVVVKRVPGSQTHSESIDWTPKEIIDMINSDIIFYVDAGVDTYIPNNANSTFADANAKLVNLSNTTTYNKICVSSEHIHDDEEVHEEDTPDDDGVLETCETAKIIDDPHFWLDPVRMLEVARYVKAVLLLEYPENSELIIENFASLQSRLETLHTEYEKMAVEAIKPIVTTSLLFSYYEARYGIEIISMATTPHSGENIPSDIIEISEDAKVHDIHYILFEKNVNSPAGDALMDELGKDETYEVYKGYLHGLGTLLTEEIEQAEDYLSIMYDNLDTLKAATK